ncbi:hypothetical protein ACFX16_047042 [Malus domestica]
MESRTDWSASGKGTAILVVPRPCPLVGAFLLLKNGLLLLVWTAIEAFNFDCGLMDGDAISRNNGGDENNGRTEWTLIGDGILGCLPSP